ncbi:MAG: citrate (Si)-synthase, partial [Bacteroidota bacterium]
MESLKKKFAEKALALFTELRAINKEHGDKPMGEVTLKQVTGGARGIKMMLWETSQLDAQEGIRFRGYSIPELQEKM